MLGEFEQIAQIMAPLAEKVEGAFALKNDAAVFSHRAGYENVITTDTLIAGVHFFADDDPRDIAHKLMAVNLSDLAAMGATPRYYTLNASYPDNIDNNWIRTFASGLGDMQDRYSIYLLGGDTTRTTGPLTLSLSAIGEIGQGKSLTRQGANIGDLLCVSGTIGDCALGLLVAQGKLADTTGTLHKRYLRPTPRVELGQKLVGLAHTCLDISDGLVTDFEHMNVSADIHIKDIPLSTAAQHALQKDSALLSSILNGGDDYELLFSIAHNRQNELLKIAQDSATKISVIGRITDKNETRLITEDGTQLTDLKKGYRHF
ncbi:MAG: thiamine-phosphate kinase [Terasakiella sp.]|uniref:thiamine-phosphate kinase n=1 Tax=unclassified Terasakiella TaxID=2614952 RepID=UPI003B001E80